MGISPMSLLEQEKGKEMVKGIKAIFVRYSEHTDRMDYPALIECIRCKTIVPLFDKPNRINQCFCGLRYNLDGTLVNKKIKKGDYNAL